MKKSIFSFILSITLLFLSHFALASATPDYDGLVQQMTTQGDALLAQYNAKNNLEIMNGFSKLYFEIYEEKGLEVKMMKAAPAMGKNTESLFLQLINATAKNQPKAAVEKLWHTLSEQLKTNLTVLRAKHQAGFLETFIQSLIILFREGFEAILIIVALIAYLRRMNQSDKIVYIHYSAMTAIAASVATAFGYSALVHTLKISREVLEGSSMFIAAFVLLYVSYWIFEHGLKRKKAINSKVEKAVKTSNVLALTSAAFFAIYREGAETILFYQALIASSHGAITALLSGFLTAIILLMALYFTMTRASIKLPLRTFFTVTAVFLYYMAFTFIGRAIVELQEANLLPFTPINHLPEIAVLGIYPTVEGLISQCIFLLPTIAGLWWWYKKQLQFKVASAL